MKKMRSVQPDPSVPTDNSAPPVSEPSVVSARPSLPLLSVERPAAWSSAQNKPAGWPVAPPKDRLDGSPPPVPSEAAPDADRAPAIPWPGAARPAWPAAPTNGSSHAAAASAPGWSPAAAPVLERPLTLSTVEPSPARQPLELSPTRLVLAPPAPAPVPPDPVSALAEAGNSEAETKDIWDEGPNEDEPKKEEAKTVIPWRPALRPSRSASELDEEVSRLLEAQRALKKTISHQWLGLAVSAVLALSGMYQARQARQIALNAASSAPAVVTPAAALQSPPVAAPPASPSPTPAAVNTSAVLPAVPVPARAASPGSALQNAPPVMTNPAVMTFTQNSNAAPSAPAPTDRKAKKIRHDDN